MGYLIAFLAGGFTAKFWWPVFMKAYTAHIEATIERAFEKRDLAKEDEKEDD